MKTKGFTLVEVLIVAVVLTAVGALVWRAQSSQNTNNSVAGEDVSEVKQLPEDISALATIEQLDSVVADKYAGDEVLSVKLVQEDDGLVYELELGSGKTIYIDANTGLFIREAAQELGDDDDERLTQAQFKSVVLSFSQAVEKAKQRYPGVAVEDVELTVEDGKVVYSVDFVDETRVDIDATDGEVQRFKNDTVDERPGAAGSSSDDDSRDDSSGSSDDNDDDDDSSDDDDDSDDSSNSGSGSGN